MLVKLHGYKFIKDRNRKISGYVEENQVCNVDVVKFTCNLLIIESKLHEFKKRHGSVLVSKDGGDLCKSNSVLLASIVNPMIKDLENLKSCAVSGGLFIALHNQDGVATCDSGVINSKYVAECDALVEKLYIRALQLRMSADNGVCFLQVQVNAYNLSSDIESTLEDCKVNIRNIMVSQLEDVSHVGTVDQCVTT
ncbi:MAG: hypothetical protein ACTJLM_01610 [Ehrlichia sp.]